MAAAEKAAAELAAVKKLKVAELKEALQARGLDVDGKKDKLAARLEAAIKKEAADASAAAEAAAAAAAVAAEADDDGDGEAGGAKEEEKIRENHERLSALLAATRAERVASAVDAPLRALRELSDALPPWERGLVGAAAALAAQAAPALAAHVAAVQWAVHQALQYHGELVRLELVLLSTFARLFADGFCTQKEEEGDGGGGHQKTEDGDEGRGWARARGRPT